MAYVKKDVPIVVVKRLPRYYRHLTDLLNQGVTRISSKALSQRLGVTASQIRQDFNCFGGFGQQGYGYNVEHLRSEIADILGINKGYKTILMGAGNLGHALANHANFQKRGFTLIGVFDVREEVIGTTIAGVKVYDIADLESFMKTNKPEIAILALPKSSVREMAQKLCELGIKGIWNFSYSDFDIPVDVPIENVHLSDSLMTLSYNITKKNEMSED